MIGQGELLPGRCRFSEKLAYYKSPRGGPIFILERDRGVFLCKLAPHKRVLSASPSSVICYQDTAQVIPWKKEESNGESNLMDLIRNNTKETFKIHPKNDDEGVTCHPCNPKHKHAIISDESPDVSERKSSFCCYSTELQARPLLSISFRLKGNANPGSLALSRLKRSLAGFCIAFKDGRLTTEIKLALEEGNKLESYIVESVTTRSTSGKQEFLYWILPSTMITVLPSTLSMETSKKPIITSATQKRSLSPSSVALNLVHLVRGLRLRASVPSSCLLSGPPGVGKTHAVRETYEICRKEDHTVLLSLGLLVGSEENPSQISRLLARIFEKAATACEREKDSVVILFIDECDALLSSEVVAGMLSSLMNRMTQGNESCWKRILVVGATNTVDSIPSYLRFETEIVVSPPTAEERFHMLSRLIDTSFSLFSLAPQTLHVLAEECVGYVAADLVALVRRAVTLALGSSSELIDEALFRNAMADVGASALRESSLLSPPATRWDDVAGQVTAKKILRQAIEWPISKKEKIESLRLQAPKGVLCYGPPGCAKTTIARACAGAAGCAFLAFSPSDIYSSSYVGEAEKTLRDAFKLARSARPCILFFDEIDAIVGAEGNDNQHGMNRSTMSSAESRVLSTFLNEMDGVDGSSEDGVIVLAATNRPWTLDKALLRSGRFDHAIYVPPPNYEGRFSIFKMFCQANIPNDAIEHLASDEVSGLMTGAEIVGACRASSVRALKRAIDGTDKVVQVTLEDLLESLSATQPLLSQPGYLNAFVEFERNRQRL